MTSLRVPLYITRDEVIVSYSRNRLVARDAGGTVLRSIPIHRISEVVVTGTASVTPHALPHLLRDGIPLVLLDGIGRPLGRLEPAGAAGGLDRRLQAARSADDDASLQVARGFVAGKIANQRALLRRRLRWQRLPDRAEVIRAMDRHHRYAQSTTRRVELLGTEGAASAAYYRALRRGLPVAIGFERRSRSQTDVMNATLNYCSALLRETVRSAIAVVGLAPDLSFLHQPVAHRPTLAFDLMEEWRAPLVEAVAFSVVGLRAVGPHDLRPDDGRLLLNEAARARCVERYVERVSSLVTDASDGWRGTYRDGVHRQVLRLRQWLRTGAEYRPFTWR